MDRVWQTVTTAPSIPYTLLGGLTPDTAAVPALSDTTTITFDEEGNQERVVSIGSGSSNVTPDFNYTYDRLNRLLTRDQGAGPRSITYDLAGNVITTVGAGNVTVHQRYDALNRLVWRQVPSRSYGQQNCTGFPVGPITGPGGTNACFTLFPFYPNNGTGLLVRGDTVEFDYDAAGNMTLAENWVARTQRSYYPNGLLKTDTTLLKNSNLPGTSQTQGQRYEYDLAGRRLNMHWARGTTSYGYHPYGALASVTDPLQNRYAWTYNTLGQQTEWATVSPAQVTTIYESRAYDLDGRLARRSRESRKDSTWLINRDSLMYDLRGKVIGAHTASRAIGTEEHRLAYDGIGAVTAAQRSRLGAHDLEEFRNDAFGNTRYSRTRSSAWGEGMPQNSVFSPGGELMSRLAAVPPPGQVPQNTKREELEQSFTGGGNLALSSYLRQDVNSNTIEEQKAARYYYDGNDRLAVAQRYVYHDGSVMSGAWEEIRYDALGRKVVTRVRREASGAPSGKNPLCTSTTPGVCGSYVERTWWDGDQLLVETRTAEGTPNPTIQGSVGYVHGPGIDQPVAVLTDDGARVFNYSWRGVPESSLWANGAPGDCALVVGSCTTVVSWASQTGAYFTPYLGGVTVPSSAPTWLGSLSVNGAGGTGLLYRRNRYYDPQSGRFTQQDPIGLGGGLNVYGFAGGDPVTYSDPFGLCIPWPWCLAAAAGGGSIAVGGGGAAVAGASGAALPVAAAAGLLVTGWASLPVNPTVRSQTNPAFAADATGVWGGRQIPTAGRRPTAAEDGAVQGEGGAHGCMTCGTTEPGTPTERWIRNHVPPTSVRVPGEPQALGPHCQDCSNKQGGWLSQLLRRLRDGGDPPTATP